VPKAQRFHQETNRESCHKKRYRDDFFNAELEAFKLEIRRFIYQFFKGEAGKIKTTFSERI
jgi:DNA primase catalytic subunit